MTCRFPSNPDIQQAFASLDKCIRYESYCEPEADEAHEELESKGYEIIGGGASRYAWDLGECVLKSPINGHDFGAKQNRTESEVWTQADMHGVTDYLARVYDASPSGSHLVMEKADTSLSLDRKKEIVRELETKLRDQGIFCKDIKEGNVGEVDGEPVLIDYGWDAKCKVEFAQKDEVKM